MIIVIAISQFEDCSHGEARPHPNGFVEILANLQ